MGGSKCSVYTRAWEDYYDYGRHIHKAWPTAGCPTRGIQSKANMERLFVYTNCSRIWQRTRSRELAIRRSTEAADVRYFLRRAHRLVRCLSTTCLPAHRLIYYCARRHRPMQELNNYGTIWLSGTQHYHLWSTPAQSIAQRRGPAGQNVCLCRPFLGHSTACRNQCWCVSVTTAAFIKLWRERAVCSRACYTDYARSVQRGRCPDSSALWSHCHRVQVRMASSPSRCRN